MSTVSYFHMLDASRDFMNTCLAHAQEFAHASLSSCANFSQRQVSVVTPAVGCENTSPVTMAAQTAGCSAAGSAGDKAAGSSALSRKKDGGPCAEFWESGETVSQLETIRTWIGKHYKKVSASSVTERYELR